MIRKYNKGEAWLLIEKYAGVESEAFHTDIAQLHSGTPLAYIIGYVPFLNCVIYLDSHPLIPRTETEYWAEKAIHGISNSDNSTPNILDLCAGSGAIGIAVAKTITKAKVDFAEIDHAHIPTIKKNIETNLKKHSNLLEYITGDLFENVNAKYDFILTNPPYVDPSLGRVEMSVKTHEPRSALYGGIRGINYITKIISQAPMYLKTNGQLWIEHEPEQSEEINTLAKKYNFLCSTNTDQYHIERYSILVVQ